MNTYFEYQAAIFTSDLSSNARLLAWAIASHYNWTKQEAGWPSNETLHEETGLGIRTITRAKRELEEKGYLKTTRRFDSTNLYEPTIPMLPQSTPMASQARGYGLTGQRVWPHRPTNSEVNYELNNEVKNKEEQAGPEATATQVPSIKDLSEPLLLTEAIAEDGAATPRLGLDTSSNSSNQSMLAADAAELDNITEKSEMETIKDVLTSCASPKIALNDYFNTIIHPELALGMDRARVIVEEVDAFMAADW